MGNNKYSLSNVQKHRLQVFMKRSFVDWLQSENEEVPLLAYHPLTDLQGVTAERAALSQQIGSGKFNPVKVQQSFASEE